MGSSGGDDFSKTGAMRARGPSVEEMMPGGPPPQAVDFLTGAPGEMMTGLDQGHFDAIAANEAAQRAAIEQMYSGQSRGGQAPPNLGGNRLSGPAAPAATGATPAGGWGGNSLIAGQPGQQPQQTEIEALNALAKDGKLDLLAALMMGAGPDTMQYQPKGPTWI